MPATYLPTQSAGIEEKKPSVPGLLAHSRKAGMLIALSSLTFAVLQSVCTFFAAVDGLRVAIGVGSLALASGTTKAIDAFHLGWLRVPMLVIAVAGSVLNLVVLWQVRRLRANPAARWRQSPVSPKRVRLERVQLALSVLTLVLVVLEERQHLIWLRHW